MKLSKWFQAAEEAKVMTDEEHKKVQVCTLFHLEKLDSLMRNTFVLVIISIVVHLIQTILLLLK